MPFGQDNPITKPYSITFDFDSVIRTIEYALDVCPCCGGTLEYIDTVISDIIDYENDEVIKSIIQKFIECKKNGNISYVDSLIKDKLTEILRPFITKILTAEKSTSKHQF